MTFNYIILKHLSNLFKQYQLSVVRVYEGYIELRSERVVVLFSHNERESSNLFQAGKNESRMNEINDNILRVVFNSNIKLDSLPRDVFAANLELFFRSGGGALLAGNEEILNAVETESYKVNKLHTMALLERQLFTAADKAWKDGDYLKFIQNIDRIRPEKLPGSYKKKYEIASRRMKQ